MQEDILQGSYVHYVCLLQNSTSHGTRRMTRIQLMETIFDDTKNVKFNKAVNTEDQKESTA